MNHTSRPTGQAVRDSNIAPLPKTLPIPKWIPSDVDRLRETLALALGALTNPVLTTSASRVMAIDSILRADEPQSPKEEARARVLMERFPPRSPQGE
jgi:hypothetical protein